MFPGIYLFLLGCPVCWHILFTVVSCEPLYFNLSVVISPLSFLNLSESSLLPGEASYWFVYFVDFSISQLLMWLFSIAFFSFWSLSFISSLIFVISFLLLNLNLILLFLVPWGVKCGCYFEAFLVSWGEHLLRWTSFFEPPLPHPINFSILHLCFCLKIFFKSLFWFLLWPNSYSVVCCLIATYLWFSSSLHLIDF